MKYMQRIATTIGLVALGLSASISHAETYSVGITKNGFSITDQATGQRTTWKDALLGTKPKNQAPKPQVVAVKQDALTQQEIDTVFSEEFLNLIAQEYMTGKLKTKLSSEHKCQSVPYVTDFTTIRCVEPAIVKQVISGQASNIYMLFEQYLPDGGAAPEPAIGVMVKVSFNAGPDKAKIISHQEELGSRGRAGLKYGAKFTQLGTNQYGWIIQTDFKEEQTIQVFGDIDNQIKPLSEPANYGCPICMSGEEVLREDYNTSDEIEFIGIDQANNQEGYYPLKFKRVRTTYSKKNKTKNKLKNTTSILTVPFNATTKQYDFSVISPRE